MLNFYAILPAPVRYSKNLSPQAKLLYAEITALSNPTGFCRAQNKYFAHLFNVPESTIQNWLQSIVQDEFVFIEQYTSKEGIKERHIILNHAKSESRSEDLDVPYNLLPDEDESEIGRS